MCYPILRSYGYSLQAIADMFNLKEHTNILHHLNKHQDLMHETFGDRIYKSKIEHIEKLFQN